LAFGVFVRFSSLLPSGSMTKRSAMPNILVKRIFVPSGAHTGSASQRALVVNLAGSEPSASIT
jgi:hypothetical protein